MTEKSTAIRVAMIALATGATIVAGVFVGRTLTASDLASPSVLGATAASAKPASAPAPDSVRFKIPVTDTQPFRGPVDALVTVVEFCDLRGPVCRKSDAVLQSLMKEHDGNLRWAHRALFDMQRAAEARRMHSFARAAFQYADKFWDMRAKFLETPDGTELSEDDYKRIAKDVGLEYEGLSKAVATNQFASALAVDQAFSVKFGVSGDSVYFVNGRPLRPQPGQDLKPALKALIEAELAAAQNLVRGGVEKARVYDETIKDGRWGVSEEDELARQAALAEKR